MNRAVLGGAVAAAIAVLTGIAYFLATSSLESRIESELENRVKKSVELLVQNANLDMLKLQKRAELTARNRQLVAIIAGDANSEDVFRTLSKKAQAEGEGKPEIFAVVDLEGKLEAQMGIANPVADQWLTNGKPTYRSITLALKERQVTSEVWDFQGRGLLKVGVAPLIDPDSEEVQGALIMGYSLTATEAQQQQGLLGADVAYFYGDKVYASSFLKGNNEDTAKQKEILKALGKTKVDADALKNAQGLAEKVHIAEIDGNEYLISAGRLPRFSSKKLPDDYEPPRAGAVVLASLTRAKSAVAPVRTGIGLLGLGAIIAALLGMTLVAKAFLSPLDQIELGVNDIIHGNLDRIFEPVGRDFEGLANALNVMMARLLGRPEPGEEEYDEQGNVIMPSKLHFDTEGLSPKEAEAMALAQEPETDYYKRIYDEYLAARKEHGEPVEGISFDSFVAKLHLNEATLKRKYECTSVRFKVLVKDGKVILKPVPIA